MSENLAVVALRNIVIDLNAFDFSSRIEDFAFLGFDEIKVIEKLHQKQPNEAKLKKDCMILASIYIQRGPKAEKYEKGMSPAALMEYKSLRNFYGLEDTAKDGSDLTMQRICRLFAPQIIQFSVATGTQIGPVPHSALKGYPFCCCNPLFSSMIPAGDEWGCLTQLCALYNIKFRTIVKAKNSVENTKKDINIANSSRNSELLTDEFKIDTLIAWGVLKVDAAGLVDLTDTTKAAVEKAAFFITELAGVQNVSDDPFSFDFSMNTADFKKMKDKREQKRAL